MKSTPIPTKQNLFLFLPENESQYLINRKLVLLYANHCVIDEDAQFEISGVFNLQYESDAMIEPITEAFEIARSNESAYINTHLIIGSIYSLESASVKVYEINALKNYL